jgi:hypothetical protein
MAPVSVIILSYPVSERKEQREFRIEDINCEKERAWRSGKPIKHCHRGLLKHIIEEHNDYVRVKPRKFSAKVTSLLVQNPTRISTKEKVLTN